MCCYNSCCNINYMCSSPSLTDLMGSFYYPCDGMKRMIFMSSTPRPTTKLNIMNTGSCALTVELTQNNAGTLTPKQYTVNAGQSMLITEINIINIYVMGTCSFTPCYSSCCSYSCNCYCNNYYSGASGNYSITN